MFFCRFQLSVQGKNQLDIALTKISQDEKRSRLTPVSWGPLTRNSSELSVPEFFLSKWNRILGEAHGYS